MRKKRLRATRTEFPQTTFHKFLTCFLPAKCLNIATMLWSEQKYLQCQIERQPQNPNFQHCQELFASVLHFKKIF